MGITGGIGRSARVIMELFFTRGFVTNSVNSNSWCKLTLNFIANQLCLGGWQKYYWSCLHYKNYVINGGSRHSQFTVRVWPTGYLVTLMLNSGKRLNVLASNWWSGFEVTQITYIYIITLFSRRNGFVWP